MSLFSRIFDVLFPPRNTQVLVRDTNFLKLKSLYQSRNIHIQTLSVSFLLSYRSLLVQAFILEAKFHGNHRAQEFLGKILAEHLQAIRMSDIRNKRKGSEKCVLVPLPLGEKRKKVRGYNQTEEITKCALKELTERQIGSSELKYCIAPDLLIRTRETTSQTSLGRAMRLQNMQGAFSTNPELGLDSEPTYILLDDVVTTGSTLLAAYQALQTAGAKNILVLALAH